MPDKFALYVSHSIGMLWNEVQGILWRSHHLAYVVLDFFDILLYGA